MWRLDRYFLRQYAGWLGLCALVFLFAGALAELAEFLRLNAKGAGFSLPQMLLMALLKLPPLLLDLMPFLFLVATAAFFLQVSERQELLSARTSGMSLMRLLAPLLGLAFLVNLLSFSALSSLAAASYNAHWKLRHPDGTGLRAANILNGRGLWLQQEHDDGYRLFYAQRRTEENLRGVSVLEFDNNGAWLARWDADDALWLAQPRGGQADGAPHLWRLRAPLHTNPDGTQDTDTSQKEFPIAFGLTQLQQQFPSLRTVGFWQLPALVRAADAMGLSPRLYRMSWHKQLAGFLLLWAMVALAAAFGLLQAAARRASGFSPMRFALVGGLVLGVSVYFLVDFLQDLGQAGWLSPWTAAWVPPSIAVLVPMAWLWRMEDRGT